MLPESPITARHSKPHTEEQRRAMIYARATMKLLLGVTVGTVNVTVPSYNEKPWASGVSKSGDDDEKRK